MYYNFVRIHKTLRTTPAMAAKVTERLWEIGDIVDVLETWEAAHQRHEWPPEVGSLVPASVVNDPKHWRMRAEEARALADKMSDELSKKMMLGIAEDYDRLAERAEERAKRPPQSK